MDRIRHELPGAFVLHIPNEGVRGGRAGMRDGLRRRDMGVQGGAPDILVIWGGRAMFFEVKPPRGVVSASQTEAGAVLQALGAFWAVVRSQDDVVDALRSWGFL